jgi:hypothetical protein
MQVNKKHVGKLIKDPWRIIELANTKKCVTFHGMRIPAAVVQNWQLRFLLNQIDAKHLNEYKGAK